MSKLIAVPSKAWSAKKDVETIRKDVAERGFVVEVVEVLEEVENAKPKVTGYELHIEVPEKVTNEDKRTKRLQDRLERHYKLTVKPKRG